ncbi:MAG TPA: DUF2868 domain-containing protein [Gammaproteobacteria bacterium]|nr:DUF2868 domain-containing protein [Gammaproteobacteria bacterium]
MPDRPDSTLFEDAIDVPLWLERDRDTPYAERLHRDREIARAIDAATPVERVRAWWRRVEHEEPAGPGRRLEAVRRIVSAAMALLGLFGGSGLALAAFSYNGTEPVNVVKVLAVLVGLQSIMLVLTLVLLIPGRVPLLSALQDAIATINPGAFAASIYRRLAHPQSELAPLFGWHPGRATATNRFAKWQLLRWSQVAAVAFNVAALATAVLLITFTDLAFGWSTTLSADAETVGRIVRAAAWPWHAVLPGAVPDQELIARSQFFRLQGSNTFDLAASRELTGWWSFTVLAIATYGLLPRLLLFLFAGARLRAAERTLLLEDARVTALLDRMATPEIETAADAADLEQQAGPPPAGRAPPTIAGSAAGVIWSHGVDEPEAAAYARERLGLELAMLIEAGGERALDEDRAAIEALRAAGQRTIVIFTPAWEPPLLEFLDFVAALRRELGAGASILVTPVAEDDRVVTDVESDMWSRAVGRLADPGVYLEVGGA